MPSGKPYSTLSQRREWLRRRKQEVGLSVDDLWPLFSMMKGAGLYSSGTVFEDVSSALRRLVAEIEQEGLRWRG